MTNNNNNNNNNTIDLNLNSNNTTNNNNNNNNNILEGSPSLLAFKFPSSRANSLCLSGASLRGRPDRTRLLVHVGTHAEGLQGS